MTTLREIGSISHGLMLLSGTAEAPRGCWYQGSQLDTTSSRSQSHISHVGGTCVL